MVSSSVCLSATEQVFNMMLLLQTVLIKSAQGKFIGTVEHAPLKRRNKIQPG